MSLLRVKVPASSANLGSGFDTVGWPSPCINFFDVLEILPTGQYEIDVIGEGGETHRCWRKTGLSRATRGRAVSGG